MQSNKTRLYIVTLHNTGTKMRMSLIQAKRKYIISVCRPINTQWLWNEPEKIYNVFMAARGMSTVMKQWSTQENNFVDGMAKHTTLHMCSSLLHQKQ